MAIAAAPCQAGHGQSSRPWTTSEGSAVQEWQRQGGSWVEHRGPGVARVGCSQTGAFGGSFWPHGGCSSPQPAVVAVSCSSQTRIGNTLQPLLPVKSTNPPCQPGRRSRLVPDTLPCSMSRRLRQAPPARGCSLLTGNIRQVHSYFPATHPIRSLRNPAFTKRRKF